MRKVSAVPYDQDVNPVPPQLGVMFRLTPEACERAGIKIRMDGDAVEILGQCSPVQMFDSDFVTHLRFTVGDRESDNILDRAGHAIQTEMFINQLRKALT